MVYYRKYRPQTIAELDSSTLRETLTGVLLREDVPHAFLLTGPKGLGKTSTARIIAKSINCEHRKKGSIEPDNTCEQCVSITNGSNMDVLEIDGASNRGIDEIRDLRDKVKLAPSRAKKKVYIIDEVHMLTTEAFNALLKTIEEPPAHVMFIFCTTEPHKVPATILSRCFHVAFPRATSTDIVHALERVVAGEKIDITKDVLSEIATLADGGFRDATKILEELVMLAGDKKITKELLEQKYHAASIMYYVTHLLSALSKKNVKESLGVVAHIVEEGIDIKYFISQLLEVLHTMMLEQVGISQIQEISNIKFPIEDIQSLALLFSSSYQETKYAVIPQLPLELAIVAWCNSTDEVPMVHDKENDKKHPLDAFLKKEKNLKVQALLKGPKDTKIAEDPKVDRSSQEELSEKTTKEQFMENLIYKVKSVNFSVAGVLRGCTLKKLADGEVVFETSYKFHKERLDEGKTKEVLEKAVKEITGKELKIMVQLTQGR